MVYFSESLMSFIPEGWKGDGTYTAESWPKDAVILTTEESNQYWKIAPPEGKVLGSSKEGRPCWVDMEPPSKDELITQATSKKYSLQGDAEYEIKPLERARLLGIATDIELELLAEWERYSVLLMRVDTSLAPDIEWPQKPQ